MAIGEEQNADGKSESAGPHRVLPSHAATGPKGRFACPAR